MAVLPPPYTPRKPSPPSRSRTLNILPTRSRNRSLSIKSRKDNASVAGSSAPAASKHRFSMATLRGMQQPGLSKKLFKLIKSENHVIGAYETAARERISIASQLSDWGEATGDDAVSELSDKLGVLLSELGEQENTFAENLEEYRGILKQIRNTEGSVQPSRDHKAKVSEEIQRLKYREPQSTKLAQLEQELVRAEAENLVAEAQLTNITRQKLKEAYDLHLASVIERAEKQIILARHGRRLLNLLDDTPIIPGDTRPAFEQVHQARQILNDAEDDLRDWQADYEPIPSSAGTLEANLMPAVAGSAATASVGHVVASTTAMPLRTASPAPSLLQRGRLDQYHHQHHPHLLLEDDDSSPPADATTTSAIHPAYRKNNTSPPHSRRFVSGGSNHHQSQQQQQQIQRSRNNSLYSTTSTTSYAGAAGNQNHHVTEGLMESGNNGYTTTTAAVVV